MAENESSQQGGAPNKQGLEDKLEQYQKPVTYAGIGIIALVALFFGYNKFVKEPAEEEAKGVMFKAEQWFELDSLQLALDGNSLHAGFLEIADEYSGTSQGNLANYYAGITYLRLSASEEDQAIREGLLEDAISYLGKFSTDSEVFGPLAAGAIGDCYSDLGDYEKAAAQYEKAASSSENPLTAPIYLKKAGAVYEELGNYSAAVKVYTRIKEDFADTEEGRQIEKYLARASTKAKG